MTYTIRYRLDNDAFAMMSRARTFCGNDEDATAVCVDIKGDVEIWEVKTSQDISNTLDSMLGVLSYEVNQ